MMDITKLSSTKLIQKRGDFFDKNNRPISKGSIEGLPYINHNFKELPTPYLNGVKWEGMGSFVNGYNGYEKTVDDSFMCAVIDNSYSTDGIVNYLKDENGNLIYSDNRRGQNFLFK